MNKSSISKQARTNAKLRQKIKRLGRQSKDIFSKTKPSFDKNRWKIIKLKRDDFNEYEENDEIIHDEVNI